MEKKRNEWIGGVILVLLGLYFLLDQYVDLPIFENLGAFFLLGLGLIFMVWGIVTRKAGLMIPGGILSGIGAGIALLAGPFDFSGDMDGGIFMGAFALGWVSITVFSALFSDETQWWALIPAAIMALISGALLVAGPFEVALEWLGKLWPLALIAAGVATLWGARQLSQKEETTEFDEKELLDQLKSEQ